MQNESYPRRNMASQPFRRGSQRAGRSPRAMGEEGRSFCGLLKYCALRNFEPVHHLLVGANVEAQTRLHTRQKLTVADRSDTDGRKTCPRRLGIRRGTVNETVPNIGFRDDRLVAHSAIFGMYPQLSRDASRWT